MSETRKLVAILVADVVGYSRLAGADEDRTLSRCADFVATSSIPIAAHHGRIVSAQGMAASSSSVASSMPCAAREVQKGRKDIYRHLGSPPSRQTTGTRSLSAERRSGASATSEAVALR
jgi:adenylate cyclase